MHSSFGRWQNDSTYPRNGSSPPAEGLFPVLSLQYPPAAAVLIVLTVFAVWILVVFGNLLVILAIARDRKVAIVQNWFLASLAFADLLLGLLVMPFSLANQLLGSWIFGVRWCELWLAIDVLMCTSSIMNLCLISLDRYWCVSRALTYPRQRTRQRAALMIAVVWLLSALICLPPLLGWRKPQASESRCELTDEIGYVVYSSMGSFYIPMFIMVVVYARIFHTARERVRRRCLVHSVNMAALKQSVDRLKVRGDATAADVAPVPQHPLVVCSENFHLQSLSKSRPQSRSQSLSDSHSQDGKVASADARPQLDVPMKDDRRGSGVVGERVDDLSEPLTALSEAMEQKRRLAKAKERRATLVLGLIMGAFVICWLPFFTTYLVHIACRCVPHLAFDFFFWLGYCNSAINPVIYTVFNKDFRRAFRRMLSCKC